MNCPYKEKVICNYLEDFKTEKTTRYPCADCDNYPDTDHTKENISYLAGCGLTTLAIAIIFAILFGLGLIIRKLRPDEKIIQVTQKEAVYNPQ